MSQAELLKLEGRLNGLREVLEIVVAQLVQSGAEQVLPALEARQVPADQQEDPGAVPQIALLVEAAATQEIRLLLGHVAARSVAERRG